MFHVTRLKRCGHRIQRLQSLKHSRIAAPIDERAPVAAGIAHRLALNAANLHPAFAERNLDLGARALLALARTQMS